MPPEEQVLGDVIDHAWVSCKGAWKSAIRHNEIKRAGVPMSNGESETAESGPTGSGSVSARGRVLFMDDKEIVRNAVGEVLQALGYEAVCTEEGEETLELYRRALDAGKPFDVVVLDLTVVRGMGGREAIEKLLEIDPLAKVVVSSGFPNDPVMVDHSRYGASAAIIKPYNSSELDKVLAKVIES